MKFFITAFLQNLLLKARGLILEVKAIHSTLRKAFARLSSHEKRIVLVAVPSILAVVTIIAIGLNVNGRVKHPLDSYVNPTQIDLAYRFRGDYLRDFNDINSSHLAAAKEWGVNPIEIDSLGQGNECGMLLVETDSVLKVDRLSHSEPYLVPEAYFLLHDIASDFAKMLQVRNIPPHRLVGTSFTRTKEQRNRLSQVNVNAAEESAHCYGTTFDISWSRFDPLTDSLVRDDKLKLILASVIEQYREAGRCYIKHERKQACFHITVIGSQEVSKALEKRAETTRLSRK